MKRLLLIFFYIICTVSFVRAQILFDKTSASPISLRDPARQASKDIDATIFNPAGIAFLDKGFYLSLAGVYSHMSINNTTSPITFSRNVSYHNVINTINPSIQMVYNWGNWAVGLSMTREGGYNNWYCRQGSSYVDSSDEIMLPTYLKEDISKTMDFNVNFNNIMFSLLGLNEAQDLCSWVGSKDLNSSYSQFNYRISTAYKYRVTNKFLMSFSLGLNVQHISYRKKFSREIWLMDNNNEVITYSDYQNDLIKRLDDVNLSDEFSKTVHDYFTDNSQQVSQSVNHLRELIELSGSTDAFSGVWGVSPILGMNLSLDSIGYHIQNINMAVSFTPGFLLSTNRGAIQSNSNVLLSVPTDFSIGLSFDFLQYYTLSVGTSINMFHYWGDGYYKDLDLVQDNSFRLSPSYATSFSFLIPNSIIRLSTGFQYSYNSIIMNYGFAFMEHKVNLYSGHIGLSADLLRGLQLNLGLSLQGVTGFTQYPLFSNVSTDFSPRYVSSIGLTYKY